MSATVPVLRLKKQEERRLRAGHLWVYSNEVDTALTPLRELTPGSEVVIEDSRGKPVGRAFVNPHSLICARIFSRNPNQSLDRDFIGQRLQQAVALREPLFADHCYRAFYGEADGISGLVIDRFHDTVVIQSGAAGVDAVLEELVAVVDQQFAPKNIVIKSDAGVRQLEGLEAQKIAAKGELPESIALTENGVRFVAPLAEGQKTGWFYDHRTARQMLMPWVKGARVLDVFSYCGDWGVSAAYQGAADVVCVDASERALQYVQQNAALNGVQDKVRALQGDAAAMMKNLLAEGEKFDVVVIDPPAFIKRKKDFKNGLEGYHRMNELALRLVKPGGILVSASCSLHLTAQNLEDVVQSSARHLDRFVQVFARQGQAADHPVHPAIPETAYLKSVFARVLMNF